MEYIFTFLEGIASFISPCLLPMIPIYITYFIGDNSQKTIRTFMNSLRIYFRFYACFCCSINIGEPIRD